MRKHILETFYEILSEDNLKASEISDETLILESGLDSLGFAILVVRLESTLGFDPFTISDVPTYPKTFGEFVSFYKECFMKTQGFQF